VVGGEEVEVKINNVVASLPPKIDRFGGRIQQTRGRHFWREEHRECISREHDHLRSEHRASTEQRIIE